MRLVTSIGEHARDKQILYQFTHQEAAIIFGIFDIIDDLTDREKRIADFIYKGINANAIK